MSETDRTAWDLDAASWAKVYAAREVYERGAGYQRAVARIRELAGQVSVGRIALDLGWSRVRVLAVARRERIKLTYRKPKRRVYAWHKSKLTG